MKLVINEEAYILDISPFIALVAHDLVYDFQHKVPDMVQLSTKALARATQDMIVRQCAKKLGQGDNWKALRPDKHRDLVEQLVALISLAAANMAYYLTLETREVDPEEVGQNGGSTSVSAHGALPWITLARATLAGEQIYPARDATVDCACADAREPGPAN